MLSSTQPDACAGDVSSLTGSGEETVSVALVTAGVGDTILVHAREAIAVLAAEAAEAAGE